MRDNASPIAAIGSSGLGTPVARFAFTDDALCPADLNNDVVVDDLDFHHFVISCKILDYDDAAMPIGFLGDFTLDSIVNDDNFLSFVQAYNAARCR